MCGPGSIGSSGGPGDRGKIYESADGESRLLPDLRYHNIQGGNKMARVINDSCISCGSCAAQCPVNAISEGDGKFEIDADTCIDCGACEGGCPVGAIEAQ